MEDLKAGKDLRIGEITLQQFSELRSENILLPELSGSEKQIAWAADIRNEWLSEFDRFIVEATANIEKLAAKNRNAQGRFDQYVETANKFIIGCSEMTSAANWINQLPKTPFSKLTEERFGDVLRVYLSAGGEINTDAAWADFYSDERAIDKLGVTL